MLFLSLALPFFLSAPCCVFFQIFVARNLHRQNPIQYVNIYSLSSLDKQQVYAKCTESPESQKKRI